MSEISYFSSPITVGAWCEEQTGGGAPVGSYCVAPPELCIYDLETIKLSAIAPAKYFPGASNYSLELWKPSIESWQVYLSEVGPDETILIETAYEIGLRARFAVHYEGQVLYSEDVPVTRFCCEGVLPPEVPAPPVLARNCAETSITVTAPAFSDEEDAETETIEIQRSSDSGNTWELVHTFTSATSWTDEGVINGEKYSYRARACNDGGCSGWSAPAAVDLISTTASITITYPTAGANLKTVQTIRISASGVDASSLKCQVNGLNIGKVLPMPDQPGQYYVWWDTRESLQGQARIVVTAVDPEGCLAKAEVVAHVVNTPANNILYFDVGPTNTLDKSWFRVSSIVRLVTGGLHPSALRQWAVRVGLRTWTDGQSDPVSKAAETPEEFESQWLLHTPVVDFRLISRCLAQGQRPEKRVFSSTLNHKRAHHIVSRYRLDPLETAIGWDLSPSTQVAKIRELEKEGEAMIFGSAPGTLWHFKDDVVTKIKELSDVGGESATDAVWQGDKIYTVIGGELRVFDTTPSDVHYTLSIRDASGALEPRPVKFLERVKDKIAVICVDKTLEPATRGYQLSGNNVTPLWEIEDAVTLTDCRADGTLLLATGQKYFSSANLAAPNEMHEFNSAITTFSVTGEHLLVGLENGEVWRGETDWALLTTLESEAVAITEWRGALGEEGGYRALAAERESTYLHEQNTGNIWSVGRNVEAPPNSGKTVSSITALRTLEWQETGTQVNLDGSTKPITRDVERLLAGTGSDGVLMVYQVSPLGQGNYPRISNVESAKVFPLTGVKPVAAETSGG